MIPSTLFNPITPEAVEAHARVHRYVPTQRVEDPEIPLGWWLVVNEDGVYRACLLAVSTDGEGLYVSEWSRDMDCWCGLHGTHGVPLENFKAPGA